MSYNNGQPPLKKVGVVESIEDKERSVKIKVGGQNFSFFKLKKDGNETAPYRQFQNMEVIAGQPLAVSYVIEEFTTQDGKRATSNKAIHFQEANGLPLEKPRVEPNIASQSNPDKPSAQYWEDKALAQCLWNYWLRNKEDVPPYWKQEVYKVFKEINEFVENPTEDVGETDGVDVSKIPF